MTAITELGLAGIATSTFMVPDWSLPDWSTGATSAIASERPNGAHVKADAMPMVAFDVPDMVNVQSLAPQSPVILENPANHSPRVTEALLPPSITSQQFSEELDGAVRSRYSISRVGFEAAWSNGNDQQANTVLERTWVHLPVTQREVVLSVIPDVRPPGQPDWDVDWHEKTANSARSRLARESGYTPDDLMAMTPGSALDTQIRGNAHLSKLLAKAERHERYLADAREKQEALDKKWADDHYANTYATNIYEPVRVARDAAIAASDTKVAHVLYTDGKPAKDVPFEGYGQSVDVRGKRLTAIHQAFDPRVAQDLALEAEEAVEAARVARTALAKAQIDGNGFGSVLMASGMPISAFVYGAFGVIDKGTEGIQNPAVRKVVREVAKITFAGGLAITGAGLLGGCVAPPTPHAPTLPPPGGETTLSAAHETGAMMAQMPEVRALYNALASHGVDPSACSPDVLGSLVVERNLPLETVIELTKIATDALANTPEPDHLKAMVCDAVPGANGTETVTFHFSADSDFTGDGTPDILIPSRAQVLLPGQLVDGVPQVVTPFVEGQPPAGSLVVAPNWSASGGEIPAEIRGLITVEEESIRASFAAQGIDPNSIFIHDVFRGSGNDFRVGSGMTNLAQTIAFYPKFDDNIDGFGWRPDLRPSDRAWHWQSVSLPEGVNGKIEVVFDSGSEAPQFIVVTPDESQMMGWFNNLTGQWLTKDGNELTQTLAATATLPATLPAPATETPAPTATPAELLGGDKTSVVFAISYGSGFVYDIPKEVQPALIPTTPEQWNALTMPTRADGTQVPWGKLITIQRSDSVSFIVMPVLIKAVVEIPNTGNVGGTFIMPVYEIPAKGGSNFIIPVLQKNRYSTSENTSIYTLNNGIPEQWQNGAILDVPTYKAAVQSRGVNGADYGAELRKHIGKVVLILFPRGDYAEWNNALTKISTGELASSSGSINQNAQPGGLILP